MAKFYDSELIREAAHRARRLADRVEENVGGLTERTQDDMELIKGETARAIEEKIALLERQIRRLGYEISDISGQLNKYADALETVGKDLAEIMRSGR